MYVSSLCSRILIDTGEANKPEYVSLLKETLEKLKARVSQVIITHWHHDHIGGLEGVCSLYPSELYILKHFIAPSQHVCLLILLPLVLYYTYTRVAMRGRGWWHGIYMCLVQLQVFCS